MAKNHFNTSHVNVNPGGSDKASPTYSFQYISC